MFFKQQLRVARWRLTVGIRVACWVFASCTSAGPTWQQPGTTSELRTNASVQGFSVRDSVILGGGRLSCTLWEGQRRPWSLYPVAPPFTSCRNQHCAGASPRDPCRAQSLPVENYFLGGPLLLMKIHRTSQEAVCVVVILSGR